MSSPVALLLPASPAKFLVLSVSTVFLYTLLWIYKTWLFVAKHEGKSRWAALRTFFAPFVTWSALGSLRRAFPAEAASQRVPLEVFGAAWGLMVLAPNLLRGIPAAGTVLLLASPLALLPAVRVVNAAVAAAGAPPSACTSWSRPEVAFLLGGLLLWAFVIF